MKHSDLIQQLTTDLKPVKPLASHKWRFAVTMLISLVTMASGIAYWYYRKSEFHIPAGRSFFEGLVLIACVCLSGWLAVKSASPHHSSAKSKKGPIYLFILWFVILAVAFVSLFMQTQSEALIALKYNTWLCPIVILTITIPLAALSWWYLQKGALLFPKTTFYYWGTMATATGALGLSFICPWTDPLHEILWHVIPSLLFIFTGFIIMSLLYKLIRKFRS